MSIGKKILQILNTPTGHYKGMRVNILGLPVFNSYHSRSVDNSLYALQKEGYVNKREGSWVITPRGRKYLASSKSLREFGNQNKRNAPKNLLVLYDIPEEQKKEREWFRRHLRKFDFIMIQRSVWVGPSPLPKEFLNYVKSIKLEDSIKTFKLRNGYGSK